MYICLFIYREKYTFSVLLKNCFALYLVLIWLLLLESQRTRYVCLVFISVLNFKQIINAYFKK